MTAEHAHPHRFQVRGEDASIQPPSDDSGTRDCLMSKWRPCRGFNSPALGCPRNTGLSDVVGEAAPGLQFSRHWMTAEPAPLRDGAVVIAMASIQPPSDYSGTRGCWALDLLRGEQLQFSRHRMT